MTNKEGEPPQTLLFHYLLHHLFGIALFLLRNVIMITLFMFQNPYFCEKYFFL